MELVDYFARASIASVLAPPLKERVDLSNIASAFQRRMVERDLKKLLLPRLLRADFDVLLIDFIDERFRIWSERDGGVCTLSTELLSSGFTTKGGKGTVLQSGSAEHWRLWEAGWASLVDLLRSHRLLDRVRINEVSWADRTEGGQDFEPHYPASKIRLANEFLRRIHARVAHDIPDGQFLRYLRPFVGADEHQWGRSPFHYLEGYYVHTLEQLTRSTSHAIPRNRSEAAVTAQQRLSDQEAPQAPVHTHASLDTVRMVDGIHHMISGTASIDFLVHGAELLHNDGGQQVLLVCFDEEADPSTRGTGLLSGRDIAADLEMPLLAIADPTSSGPAGPPLGWYAGNAEMPDLRIRIAKLLEHLAQRHRCRLVLFGGSSGGFAVLSILTLLRADAAGVVWNPQTSITEHPEDVLPKYVETAFPAIWQTAATGHPQGSSQLKRLLKKGLDTVGVVHDVTRWPADCKASLVYLQNSDDWHVRKHAAPFMKGKAWPRLGPRSFHRADAPLAIWFGEWGKGHAPPPPEVVKKVLAQLASGKPAAAVVRELDTNSGGSLNPYCRSELDGDTRAVARVRLVEGKLEASCELVPAPLNPAEFEYAYYLVAGKRRLAASWYSTRPTAVFDLPTEAKGLRVIAFVRDGMGTLVQSPVDVDVAANTLRDRRHDAHQIVRVAELPQDEAAQAQAYWSTLDASRHGTYTARQPWSGEVSRLVKAMGARRVFEFGCNAGKNLLALQQDIPGIFVAGIDINAGAIELARGKGLGAATGDERSLGIFPDRCFDITFTVSVLDHIPDVTRALTELARISSRAVVLLEPWLGEEGKGVRNFNAKLEREVDTTPYSYSWDYERLVSNVLAGWQCHSWPLPISTNLGAFYRVYALTRDGDEDVSWRR